MLAAVATSPRHGPVQLAVYAAGALIGSLGLTALAQHRRDRASRLILGGNITVLDDIGRQTARFVGTFSGQPEPDPRRLADFLAFLRPGPSAAGGQDLLRKAFTHYYHALHAASPTERHERMLLGNLYAILHGHLRPQPYIGGAMPRPARRLITRHLLAFSLGRRTLRVGEDVVPPPGIISLHPVANGELRAFLAEWDRARDGVLDSHATDWADLRDRMG